MRALIVITTVGVYQCSVKQCTVSLLQTLQNALAASHRTALILLIPTVQSYSNVSVFWLDAHLVPGHWAPCQLLHSAAVAVY